MILARVFSNIYKEGGIILIDSKGQKYICGNPRKDNPITIKLLKENLNWKLVLDPEIEFPEAYMRNEILIENSSLKSDFNEILVLIFSSSRYSSFKIILGPNVFALRFIFNGFKTNLTFFKSKLKFLSTSLILF